MKEKNLDTLRFNMDILIAGQGVSIHFELKRNLTGSKHEILEKLVKLVT